MKRLMCSLWAFTLMICMLNMIGVSSVSAAESTLLDIREDKVLWQTEDLAGDYRLVVSGPSGLIQQEFKAGQMPSLSVFNSEGQTLADGEYTWELRFRANASSDEYSQGKTSRVARWGYFTIQEGSFVSNKRVAEADWRLSDGGVSAHGLEFLGSPGQGQGTCGFFEGDAVLAGKFCAGPGCVECETFDDDTLRIKGSTPWIRFVDTDASSNDWQVAINETTNKFSIEDLGSTTTPFTIEAGAPSNSIYVDDVGRLGLGTAAPIGSLHVVGSVANQSAIFLESTDGSAETWRILNNSNTGRFTLNEVGGNVPFKAAPNSQNNLLRIGMSDDGSGNSTDNANTVVIGSGATGEDAAVLQVFGSIEVNGSTVHPDYVFQPDFDLPSIEEHAEFMWENSHLPSLPKAPAGNTGAVDLVSHQMGILEELETAHIYIDQLNSLVKSQDHMLKDQGLVLEEQRRLLLEQSRTLENLQQRLASLEDSEG